MFKEVSKGVLFLIIGIIVVLGLIIGGTVFGLWYKDTFGVVEKNIETKIYSQTKSFVEGATRDLANYKLELLRTEDPVERKAIINLIVNRFSMLDPNQINDYELSQFLRDVRNGRIQ